MDGNAVYEKKRNTIIAFIYYLYFYIEANINDSAISFMLND